MDKYEYRLKMEEIERAKEQGDYHTAGKIADTVDWSRVKSIAVLGTIADIYDKIGKYNDSREILLLAYERSPIGRMIIYRLCDVSIKLRELDDAIEYFNSFIQLAPNDSHRFILQYKIEKARGTSIDKLITILENLKARDFLENWAYELAYLYHKKGMASQCVDECNEIFLWFGEGKYVEKALELKMLYEPLSQIQRERYEFSRAKRIQEAKKANRRLNDYDSNKVPSEDELDISPLEVTSNIYNTVNLQKELAKNLEYIMSATEQEDVTKSMDTVKKLVTNSQIPELVIKEEEPLPVEEEEIPEASMEIDFGSFLAEGSDGQIQISLPEQPMVEKQITGQMSIEDVLNEWNRTMEAAGMAMAAQEAKRLENAKAQAAQMTTELINKLDDIIPQYEEQDAKTRERIAQAQEMERLNALEEAAEAERLAEEARLAALAESERLAEEKRLAELAQFESLSLDNLGDAADDVDLGEMDDSDDIADPDHLDELDEDIPEADTQEVAAAEIKEIEAEENELEKEIIPGRESWSESENNEIAEAITHAEASLAEEGKAVIDSKPEIEKTEKTSEKLTEEKPEEKPVEKKIKKQPPVHINSYVLNGAQMAALSYFAKVKGMEKQVSSLICDLKNAKADEEPSNRNNIIVSGARGMGKSKFALELIKIIQLAGLKSTGKAGPIKAAKLNEKAVKDVFKVVAGGCLLIENATSLSAEKIAELNKAILEDTTGITVILEDTVDRLAKFIPDNFEFAGLFTHHISIPVFKIDDLINFGKSYAAEKGYDIDEMGVLALYNKVGILQYGKEETVLEEVMEVVDNAIAKASSAGFRLFGRRNDKVLREKDFE